MRAVLVVAAALMLAMAARAEARAHRPRHAIMHAPRPHMPRLHPLRVPRLRAPKSSYRTVRVRRPDGTTMTGYRDSLGTHLMGPDGRTIHCRRQIGAADIDVACQ